MAIVFLKTWRHLLANFLDSELLKSVIEVNKNLVASR
jgi:hypothetical protein